MGCDNLQNLLTCDLKECDNFQHALTWDVIVSKNTDMGLNGK